MSSRSVTEEILYEKEKHGLSGVSIKEIRGRQHFLITKGNYTARCYAMDDDCPESMFIYAIRELISYLEEYLEEKEVNKMKIYILMYGTEEEAKAGQRENWVVLDRMGIAVVSDFINLSIDIGHEIKLLHLSRNNWQRLYGIKIEGWRTQGTFKWTSNNQALLDRLKLCERK